MKKLQISSMRQFGRVSCEEMTGKEKVAKLSTQPIQRVVVVRQRGTCSLIPLSSATQTEAAPLGRFLGNLELDWYRWGSWFMVCIKQDVER